MLINSPSSHANYTFNNTHTQARTRPETSTSSISGDQASHAEESSLAESKENPQQDFSRQRELQKLKSIDREVRAHEMAHLSVAGQYATSGASFSFQKGSDGRLYAVSGEVGIDTSAIPGNPQATLRKAQTIMRAALAPANPSPQDRQVAAQASAMAQQARIELAVQQQSVVSAEVGEYLDTFA